VQRTRGFEALPVARSVSEHVFRFKSQLVHSSHFVRLIPQLTFAKPLASLNPIWSTEG